MRLNLPKWLSKEGAEQLGLTSHTKSDAVAKIVDLNDPLYCKVTLAPAVARRCLNNLCLRQACAKLFAKDTVFKAHLSGGKHIKVCLTPRRPRPEAVCHRP